MIPKEHGAWGMLITTFLIGAFSAGAWSPTVLLFGGASLSYFLLRAPLLALRSAQWQKSYNVTRRQALLWLVFYSCAIILFTAPLFLVHRKWELLCFFILSLPVLYINTTYGTHEARSPANELVSFAGMSMTAPIAYYVATNELNTRTLSLYALCVLYYTGPVFYVKMNVDARIKKNNVATLKGKFSIARDALLYHAAALTVSYLLSITIAPRLSCLAFIQPFGKVLVRTFRLNEPAPIKQIGWMEVVCALLFAALIIISFRMV